MSGYPETDPYTKFTGEAFVTADAEPGSECAHIDDDKGPFDPKTKYDTKAHHNWSTLNGTFLGQPLTAPEECENAFSVTNNDILLFGDAILEEFWMGTTPVCLNRDFANIYKHNMRSYPSGGGGGGPSNATHFTHGASQLGESTDLPGPTCLGSNKWDVIEVTNTYSIFILGDEFEITITADYIMP